MALTQQLFRRKGWGVGNSVARLMADPLRSAFDALGGSASVPAAFTVGTNTVTSGGVIASVQDMYGRAPLATAVGTGRPAETTLGGKPAANFDAVDDRFVVTNFTMAAGNKTVVMVLNPTTAATNGDYLFDAQAGRLVIAHTSLAVGKMGWYDGSWREPGANSATGAQIMVFALGAGSGEIFRNGTSIGSVASAPTVPAIGGTTVIGSAYTGTTDLYPGALALLWWVSGVPSASDLLAATRLIGAHYGITTA